MKNKLHLVAELLMADVPKIDNPGLVTGKFGIAIFLYNFSRYSGKTSYSNFADNLVDQIMEGLSYNWPFNFETGLTGVGWGINYLITNKFIKGEPDEILKDLDAFVLSYPFISPMIINDSFSLLGGAIYFLSRLKYTKGDPKTVIEIKKYEALIYLMDECERLITRETIYEHSVPLFSMHQLNSFLWFILKTYNLGLFPVKSDKLIQCFTNYISNKNVQDIDIVDLSEFNQIIENLDENHTMKQCFSILLNKHKGILTKGDSYQSNLEHTKNLIVKAGWDSLFFGTGLPYIRFAKIKNYCAISDIYIRQALSNCLLNYTERDTGLLQDLLGIGISALINQHCTENL